MVTRIQTTTNTCVPMLLWVFHLESVVSLRVRAAHRTIFNMVYVCIVRRVESVMLGYLYVSSNVNEIVVRSTKRRPTQNGNDIFLYIHRTKHIPSSTEDISSYFFDFYFLHILSKHFKITKFKPTRDRDRKGKMRYIHDTNTHASSFIFIRFTLAHVKKQQHTNTHIIIHIVYQRNSDKTRSL